MLAAIGLGLEGFACCCSILISWVLNGHFDSTRKIIMDKNKETKNCKIMTKKEEEVKNELLTCL